MNEMTNLIASGHTCKLWSALNHTDNSIKYTCMECKRIVKVVEKGGDMTAEELSKKIPNYCPYCGAKVVE